MCDSGHLGSRDLHSKYTGLGTLETPRSQHGGGRRRGTNWTVATDSASNESSSGVVPRPGHDRRVTQRPPDGAGQPLPPCCGRVCACVWPRVWVVQADTAHHEGVGVWVSRQAADTYVSLFLGRWLVVSCLCCKHRDGWEHAATGCLVKLLQLRGVLLLLLLLLSLLLREAQHSHRCLLAIHYFNKAT